MIVADDVLSVLSIAQCAGNALQLPPQQLDRQLYVRTNKVIEAAGGKWNRKTRAHVFDGDAAEVDPAVAGVEWSLDDPSGSGQESVDGIVLTGADQPCVLHLVVGRPVTRCQIEVGRHVPGVGLGEGGHEVGVPIEVCEVVDAGIDTLE